jgi:hypothetical protein
MNKGLLLRTIAFIAIFALALSACGQLTGDDGAGETSAPPVVETEQQPVAKDTEAPSAEVEATDGPVEAVETEEVVVEDTGDGLVPVEVTLSKDAVCRTTAQDSGDALGTVFAGQTVTMLGKGVGAGWVAIQFPNDVTKACWVRETSVAYSGDFAALPIYPRLGAQTGPDVTPIVIPPGAESTVLVDSLCLAGPGGSYGTLRSVLAGDTVIVYGKGVGSGWYVVGIPDFVASCWIRDTAVDFGGDAASLTIYSNP